MSQELPSQDYSDVSPQEREAIRLFRLLMSEFMWPIHGPYRTSSGHVSFEVDLPEGPVWDNLTITTGIVNKVHSETGVFICIS
jgi:hypothetical protein